jgi:hypothetical protein
MKIYTTKNKLFFLFIEEFKISNMLFFIKSSYL